MRTKPWRKRAAAVSSPMPSIFIMRRPTKCSMRPTICGTQPSLLGHTHAASPSTRTRGVPHAGQWLTKVTLAVPGTRAPVSTPVILGMISPPFSTYSISPSCMSSACTMSSLCSDARFTIVPERSTGSRFATGVMMPIRPTSNDTNRRRVSARSAANL